MTNSRRLSLTDRLLIVVICGQKRLFKITGCEYCFNEHDRIAKRDGVSERQIADIEQFESSDAFTEPERVALRYAQQIASRNKVDEETYAQLAKHYNEREIVELTFCIGNWTGLSHFIVPIGLELEPKAKS